MPRGLAPVSGSVSTRPAVAHSAGDVNRGLKSLAVLLLVFVFLSSPTLISGLLSLLVLTGLLLIVPLWLLGRFGLTPVLGLFLPRPRIRPAPPATAELSFRCDAGGSPTDVRLLGHQSGVALGDTVEVRGIRINGVVYAAAVRNVTTGVVLWRDRLVTTVLLVLVDVYLALVLLAAMTS